jgi:hypothetical protein
LYGVSVVDALFTKYSEATIAVYYDVVCKLVTHMKRHRRAPHIPPLRNIPVLHAFAHGKVCQLMYSPKMTMGTGTFDGEVIERVWSELEINVVGTQRTSLENRLDTITLMADYHAITKNRQFQRNMRKQIQLLISRLVAYKLEMAGENVDKLSYKSTLVTNMKNRCDKLAHVNCANVVPQLQSRAIKSMEYNDGCRNSI